METTQDQDGGISVVGLDAVAAFFLGFSRLGGRRNSFRAGIHRACGVAGIRGSLQRNGAPVAADLFLSAASASSVRALELVVDRIVFCCVAKKGGELAGNILAGRMELGRTLGHVVCSVE